MRAAVPADVRQAVAVTPAARRSRQDHAVRAEGHRRADDGAEVARVGDAVERNEQRCGAGLGRRSQDVG